MDNNIIEGIAERIRREMKRQGLNQTQLSKMTGISKSVISNIVTCKQEYGLRQIIRISDALNVSIDYLVKGNKDGKEEKFIPGRCNIFTCLYKSGLKACCFYCKDRQNCKAPCLNNPQKCGQYVKE